VIVATFVAGPGVGVSCTRAMTTSTDDQLMESWAAGHADAGEALFERYFAAVSRFFRHKVDEVAREDLIQHTFLALLEARVRYRGEGSFRSFVFAVSYNTLRNHFRAKRRDLDRLDFGSYSVVDLGAGPSTMFANGREQRILLNALRAIPLEDQVVLEMFYVEQMSAPEICAMLDLPEGTVRSRLRRSRQRLHAAAERLGATPQELTDSFADLDEWAASLRGA
jgi:RNA polymerase sigma-70 factor (ECF subfamily)